MAKRPSKWIILATILILAGGTYWYLSNHVSKTEISKTVAQGLQQKLDSGDMAQYHITVNKVEVLHEVANKYRAFATVVMDGKEHTLDIDVVADGTNIAWETQPGAFTFAAQRQIEKALQQLQANISRATSAAQSPAEQDAPPMPRQVKALTDQWLTFNEKCRGGPGDDPATLDACDKRETVYKSIRAFGWCWGHENDIDSDRDWVKCAPGDS